MAVKTDNLEVSDVTAEEVDVSEDMTTETDSMGMGAEGDEDPTGAETVED